MTTDSQLAFFPGIAEKLGYYVYVLTDPRDGDVFYIGKGKGNRAYAHVHATLKGREAKGAKLERIGAIHADGRQVQLDVLRHGMDEATAFHVEAAAMDMAALTGGALTNLVAGHGTTSNGLASLDDLRARYGAEPIELDPAHRIILIRISKAFRSGMDDERIYEATRKWWSATPLRRRPEYAFAVHNGIVRRVFRIHSWEQRESDKRWKFTGEPADDLAGQYEWRSVASFFSPGATNPIMYRGC